MSKKHDLTHLDNAYLFERVQHSMLYTSKDSLTELKTFVDKNFEYTPEQWEYVEVQFDFDLEERYK